MFLVLHHTATVSDVLSFLQTQGFFISLCLTVRFDITDTIPLTSGEVEIECKIIVVCHL